MPLKLPNPAYLITAVQRHLGRALHQCSATPAQTVRNQIEDQGVEKQFMAEYIRKHPLSLPFSGIVLLTAIRIAIPFSSGYFGKFYDPFLVCTEGIRYVLIAGCTVVIVISKMRRKGKVLASATVIFFILVGLIPTEHFMTLGALLSIQDAGPEQIRDDARSLLDRYETETLFSNDRNQRPPFNHPIPKSELPLSLQNDNFGDVLVLDHYVFWEKFGATSLFRGFIVFGQGSDIWKDEPAIEHLGNCYYCWRIRVIDGLYWYHDVPRDEEVPTFALPLK